MSKRIFITVAENSADQHAGAFVRELKKLDETIQVDALGGDALHHAGATVHHDTVKNARMGFGAFARVREVKRLLDFTRQFYSKQKPDLHVCCDSWTMNVHFAKLAKSFGVKVLYYIAPQTWASRERRVKQLARIADEVAAILPFEEYYFRSHGVRARFVGHPLFDHVPDDFSLTPKEPPFVVGLPCGSRLSVAKANFPRQLDVAMQIRETLPETRFVVPTTRITHDFVREKIAGIDFVEAHLDGFDSIMPSCALAVTVSGTATLHLAALGVPMAIVYAGNPILWHALGRWIVRTRTYGLVNLLATNGIDDKTRHICPEFIPWYGSTKSVAQTAINLLRDPTKRENQLTAFDKLIRRIGGRGASRRVAELAMSML